MRSLLGAGERKNAKTGRGQLSKMAAMPLYGKNNFKKSFSLELKKPWD